MSRGGWPVLRFHSKFARCGMRDAARKADEFQVDERKIKRKQEKE
jgi:hypothetical protein